MSADADVYVVETPRGFTEGIDARTIDLLERLGLIRHVEDRYTLQDANGGAVGPLHHFYREAVSP